MTWIGRKKLAFIPFRRPSFDEFPVPTDWPNEIRRRVLFDPDPTTETDRSLRTYIHTVSSGRADLDLDVREMVTVDRKDVPVDFLDQQLGSELRGEGFDAAAIVMLGKPPTGSADRLGFWARFDMSEGVGVWAMEFMHCLTGFADIYTLDGFADHPNDLRAFDEMACSCGTHPSAYTKRAVGWIDASTIAQHKDWTIEYDLHSVGLVQPPPAGRWAAVQIGSQVPYLLVEARQQTDQFDGGIPGQGVIIYRIQTSDPLGVFQENLVPAFLLTARIDENMKFIPTPLTPGESFAVDGGINVQVTRALVGGFSVRVATHLVDRSGQDGTPPADAPPTACVVPGLGVHDIAYRDASGHLHELWRDAQGSTGTTDVTAIAVGGAPTAVGAPFFYVDTNPNRNRLILLYRDGDGIVRSLYWSTGEVGADNLSGTAGAPAKADGDPVGYYVPGTDSHHISYRSSDGNLHELNAVGDTPVNYGGNVTGAISAPKAAGDPTAFANAAGLNLVVYRSKANGEILSVYWSEGPSGLDRLSVVAGTPPAAGDPFGYYTTYNDTVQIVYRAGDGHIYELYWAGNDTVTGWDITPPDAPPPAPPPTGNLAAYYSAGTNTKHVFYRSADSHLHEIWWVPGGGTPADVDLNDRFGAPLAWDRPAAFTIEGSNTQHVAYRGTDNHIYEVIW
jgi:hypothetical protein